MKPAAHRGPRFTTFDLPNAWAPYPTAINAAEVIAGYGIDANGVQHGFLRQADGTIVLFDAPGAGTNPGQGTTACALNPAGDIVGYLFGGTGGQGFLRVSNGAFTVITVAGARATAARAINPSGFISGEYLQPDGSSHGFVRNSAGGIIVFDVPNAANTFPLSINPAGAIAGIYSRASDPAQRHAFVRKPNGSITTFDVPQASATYVEGSECLNAAGEIAGYYYLAVNNRRGYFRKHNATIVLFDVANSVQTSPAAINAAGEITGYFYDGGNMHGFVRQVSGNMITIDAPNSTYTWPRAISQSGHITGNYGDQSGQTHGFLWSK